MKWRARYHKTAYRHKIEHALYGGDNDTPWVEGLSVQEAIALQKELSDAIHEYIRALHKEIRELGEL